MSSDIDAQLKEIERKITMAGVYDLPGTIVFGLGIYAKFVAKDEPFHPILNNQTIVNGMLLFGILSVLWGGRYIMKLSKEKNKLISQKKRSKDI